MGCQQKMTVSHLSGLCFRPRSAPEIVWRTELSPCFITIRSLDRSLALGVAVLPSS